MGNKRVYNKHIRTDYLPTPSSAIRAMCDGLVNQSKREDFGIEMSSYGGTSKVYQPETKTFKEMCFGCAATCTIQEIFQKNVTPRTARMDKHHLLDEVGKAEVERFEYMINDLRNGMLWTLLDYYEVVANFTGRQISAMELGLPDLGTYNWEKGLPAYRKLARKLEELGY